MAYQWHVFIMHFETYMFMTIYSHINIYKHICFNLIFREFHTKFYISILKAYFSNARPT